MRLRAAYARALMGDATAACAGVTMRRTDLLAPRARFAAWPMWASRFAPLLAGGGNGAGKLDADGAAAGGIARPRYFARPVGRRHGVGAAVHRATRDVPDARVPARGLPAREHRARRDRPEGGRAPVRWREPRGVGDSGRRAGSARADRRLPHAPAFADADSLLTELRRAGIAVALLDPRGSRGSASAASPWPHSWLGREDAFQRRLALDVSAAIAPALAATGADPARVCVITEGSCAMGAALAARGDSRIRALLLASAAPSGAERGWLRATLADAAVPVFFQQGPEDVTGNEVMDRIASLRPPRLVRIADSQSGGSGLALFRAGPATGQRFSDWVRGQWKARPATPPARRR